MTPMSKGPTDQPRTIVLFGDSNTHGSVPSTAMGQRRRWAPDVRWPGLLRAALPSSVQIIEEGQGGRTTTLDDPEEGAHKNGLTALPIVLETHRPVDILVIMLGTNDMKARFGATAQQVAESIDRLCRVALASDCGREERPPALMLIAPPAIEETGPFAEIYAGAAARSVGLGPAIAKVAKHHGAGFLDAGQHVAVSVDDGIHYDADMQPVLAEAILPHLQARLSSLR